MIFGGGVAYGKKSSFNITDSRFSINKANNYGGIMFTIECSTNITESTFAHNLGSLYIFNGNLTLSGHTRFENCTEPSNKMAIEDIYTRARQEGGAITSFLSTMFFTGVINLSNNHARNGGAISATE